MGFEVYPQIRQAVHDVASRHPEPTGEFGWRFRAGDGKINGVGGEGFTREEDAERAVHFFAGDVVAEVFPSQYRSTKVDVGQLEIKRVNR
jgi:hypothetical protein